MPTRLLHFTAPSGAAVAVDPDKIDAVEEYDPDAPDRTSGTVIYLGNTEIIVTDPLRRVVVAWSGADADADPDPAPSRQARETEQDAILGHYRSLEAGLSNLGYYMERTLKLSPMSIPEVLNAAHASVNELLALREEVGARKDTYPSDGPLNAVRLFAEREFGQEYYKQGGFSQGIIALLRDYKQLRTRAGGTGYGASGGRE